MRHAVAESDLGKWHTHIEHAVYAAEDCNYDSV